MSPAGKSQTAAWVRSGKCYYALCRRDLRKVKEGQAITVREREPGFWSGYARGVLKAV